MPNQNMQGLAAILAEQGRNGDTMLMHVAPSEVQYLAGLGGITENPMTGLPEAFKFKDLLPFVGSAFLGPAFKAVGFSPGVSNFLATTASTMLGGGSLEKGIMSGLVSSSIGRLGQNLADTAPGATPAPKETGYKFGIFKKPETGTFGSRYSEAFSSPQFNPIEMAKVATEGGLENFLQQVQKPSVMLPFTIGAGELARIKAEEDYARQYQNMLDEQAERRRKIRERTPQILPPSSPYYRPPGMAQGGEVQRKFDGYSFDLSAFENMDFPELREFMASQAGQQYLNPVPASMGVIGQEPIYMPELVQEVAQVDNREAELAAAREAEMAAAREAELIRQREQAAAEAEAARVAAMQREAEIQRAAAEAAAAERERQRMEADLARRAEEAAQREAAARTRAAEEAARREAERIAAEQARLQAERQAEMQRQQQLEAQRQAELARAAQLAEEARQAEIARQQEVARQQEAARLAAEQEASRQAEFARQQEAMRVEAERQRQMEEARQAEVMRQAELQRQAEAARQAELAEIQRRADLQRQAEMESVRQQEAARIAAEEEAARAAQPTGILTALPEPETSDRQPVYFEEPAPVPATTPIPEEPVYTPPAPAPAPVITEQDIINSLFVPGAEVPQSTGLNTEAMDELFANLRKTEALQKLALEPGLLQQGFTGASGVTAPPSGAGIFATPTREEEPAINFEVSPEMAAALQEVAKPADITEEEVRAIQENPRVQALQRISDLLKNNEFGAAFDEALKAESELGGDFLGNIIDANKLRELRGPMNAEEITKFYNEMPQKVFEERYVGPGNEFKKEQAIEKNIAALGGQAGYVDPMLGVKAEETLLSKLPVKELTMLAAAAMLSTAIPGLLGSTGGGATAGGATAGGAGAAGGVGAGATAGGAAAAGATAAATAGASLAEVTIIASKLALTIPEAAALIGSVGLGTAQALAGGTAAPATTVAQTTPTQPTGLETPLDEVVVTGSRAIDPALLKLVPGSLASTNLIQGTTDIPTDIYGQVEGQPDLTEGKLDATEAQQPQEPFKDRLAEVIVTGSKYQPGILDLATIGTSGSTAAELLKGYTEPTLRPYEELPPEVDTNLDEVVVTGSRPLPISLTGLGAAGLTANQLMQGFTQPTVDPLTGELKQPPEVEQIDITKPETSLLDTLIDRGKDALTDLATSQLLGALAGGVAGGTTGGAGGGAGGYVGTGGLGYIPEGQERRYVAAPEDYRHGFLPESLFFENLNPPAVDLTTPGTIPGTTPGTTPGGRPGTIDDVIEPKATGGKIKSYSPRGYLDLIQGYNEGGEVEDEDEESVEQEVAEYSEAPMTDGSRGLIKLAQAAILGQLPEEQTDDVIQKFIDLHGNKAFRELREKTLESVANGSRKEGMIEGHTGGMDDMVEGVIGSSERVAVSPGEFIIPADVVSMLGDGNSDSGRTKLEQMMSRVRKDKTGSTKQAKPINSAKVLPA